MSNDYLKDLIEKGLKEERSSLDFEQAWNRYEQKKGAKKKIKLKKITMLVATLVCFTTGAVISAAYIRRKDFVDYSFQVDSKVIGTWQVVDYVAQKEAFNLEVNVIHQDLYLRQLTFQPEGNLEIIYEEDGELYTVENTEIFWTKNHVVDKGYKTDSSYTLESINGIEYMFYEWKNGDYLTQEVEEPGYYVLAQVTDNAQIIEVTNQGKKDNIELPFIDNEMLKGQWTSIGFVEKIGDFKPKNKKDSEEFYLRGLNILEAGQIQVDLGQGFKSVAEMSWTGDVIINTVQQTASKCILKKIRGTTYMFYEWKSGDYTLRGAQPYYYVLEKRSN